jgi:DNA-directed RNA polymerase specialized sigma24 family protein
VAVTPDWPDSELILRSRAEPALFAGIFDRHYGGLYRYLRRRIGTGPAADLAAETLVTAFTRRGAYRAQGGDARPWLYGIAHNLLRNHVRHVRGRRGRGGVVRRLRRLGLPVRPGNPAGPQAGGLAQRHSLLPGPDRRQAIATS